MYAYSENNHENFNRPVFASIDHLGSIVRGGKYRGWYLPPNLVHASNLKYILYSGLIKLWKAIKARKLYFIYSEVIISKLLLLFFSEQTIDNTPKIP